MTATEPQTIRLGIDIGGTFTDFVSFNPQTGAFETFKRLSTPHAPEKAVLNGLQNPPGDETIIKPQIVHGSTVATNALLEEKGAVTALITTAGFADVLEIGRQNRPDIYDLFAQRPRPLVPAELRFEVNERVNFQGKVLQALNPAEVEALIPQLKAAGVTSVAVCLLFSFLYPAHEQSIAQLLRAEGFTVSASCEILPEFREYERASATVINAYVAPIMNRYLRVLESQSGASDFRVIQSNGGSISARQASIEAVRCVLSGPAGGVVGARFVAQSAGLNNLLTFDMGGTSTDVSLCQGDPQITASAEIGGRPLRVPVIDIHTVGSGGGSIAYVDAGGALRVGPESAGARPGPICYNQGGTQPTVTDANLILGRLSADQFLGGQITLDFSSAEKALTELAQQAGLKAEAGLSLAQRAALGIIKVVNAHMERALRVISIERGRDPRHFCLVSFGGAGGLHAVALARSLNIPQALIPPNAATLSAFGMLAADVVKDYVQTVMLPGDTPFAELEARMAPLLAQGEADLEAENVPPTAISLKATLDMRYRGQSYELSVPFSPAFTAEFHRLHQQTYGYNQAQRAVEIVNLRLQAVGGLPKPHLRPEPLHSADASQAHFDTRPVTLSNGLADVPFYRGERLKPGNKLSGPAVIVHPDTTIFIGPNDHLQMDAYRNLMIDCS